MKLINMRPPRIGFTLMALATFAHWLLLTWNTVNFIPRYVGLFIGALGFFVMMKAWLLFKKAGTG